VKRLLRTLVILGSIVAVCAAVLGAAWLVLTRRPAPDTSGRDIVSGIDASVEIVRDGSGVPHIYASSDRDLWFAQGYVHAQDRFWQMEFWRRIGAGRLSELFGETTLGTDQFIRTMGFPRIAAQEYERLSPEARAALDAYAAGVNAWIGDRRPGELALEFELLGLQGVDVQVAPWTPVNTLTWLKIMAYDLGGNFQDEIDRLELIRAVGLERTADFFPPYRGDEMPYVVTDSELERFLAETGLPAGSTPAGAVGSSGPLADAVANLPTRLVGGVDPGAPLALGRGGGVGSNNWVVSGDLTGDGRAILANDPHLSIQMPSIWYEVALHGPDIDVAGFSFAGVPGVVVGHNESIAWGVTNVNPDVQDLYIERVNPENVLQYEVNGEWRPMTVRYEEIDVRGRPEPVVMRVRETRNGPIVSDRGSLAGESGGAFTPPMGVADAARAAGGAPGPAAGAAAAGALTLTELSLRWTALEPNRTLEAVLALDRAQSFQEFRQAAALFEIPAQNLVYADVDGNIGYQLPGRIPVRHNHDGRLPVAGWVDDYQWDGYIPFDELPSVYNPPKGYIESANQPVVSGRYPYLVHLDTNHGYRARRIADLIESADGPITMDTVAEMQRDVYNLSADELIPFLVAAAEGVAEATADGEEWSPTAREVLAFVAETLNGWDRRMDVDSVGATVFAFVWQALLEEVFADEIPPDLWSKDRLLGDISRMQDAVARLMTDPHNPWWDNVNTPNSVETRDRILRLAMVAGWEAADAALGSRVSDWTWGTLHTATFRNRTLGESGIGIVERLFNRGPVSVAGGLQQVSSTDYALTEPFEVVHVSSMRMILAPGRWDAGRLVHTTGQSGHPYDPHYDDFIDLWRRGAYHAHNWSRAAVDAHAAETLTLVPAADESGG